MPDVNNPPIYGFQPGFGVGLYPDTVTFIERPNDIFKVNYYLIIKNRKNVTQSIPLSEGVLQNVEIKDGYTFKVQADVSAENANAIYSKEFTRSEVVEITFSVPNTSISSGVWAANITYSVENNWDKVCPCSNTQDVWLDDTKKCICGPLA